MKLINNIHDLKEQCKAHMIEHELELSSSLITDGKIHRYSADSKENKRDEWYIAHEGTSFKGNCYLTCAYGSWSTGRKYTYRSYEPNQQLFDPSEYKEISELAKQKQQEAEEQLKKEHDAAAQQAIQIWQSSNAAPPSDDYLTYTKAKGIEPLDVRFGPNPNGYPSIIVPLYNNKNELRSLQYISCSIEGVTYKTFLSRGEVSGNYFTIGTITNKSILFVSEGYATGVTIFKATGLPVAVAFSSHFLRKVVSNVRSVFPLSTIIIAADNDSIGMQKAEQVALEFGCTIVSPLFPEKENGDNKSSYTDFNDLQQACGLEEVKEQLEAIQAKIAKKKTVPLTEQKDPCAAFNIEELPPVLKQYIKEICTTTNAHPLMVTCSAVASLSAIIGKRIYFSYFNSKLSPNLWILIVAGSGQFKTTALNSGARLAHQRCKTALLNIKELRKKHKGERDIEKKGEYEESILEESLKNIILPHKTTAEGLLEHLSQGHSGVILTSEFGGWLQNLEKKYNNDLKSLFTSLYDVEPVFYAKTKGDGDTIIQEPFISICGMSTPTWLRSNIKTDDFTSGFLARFLLFTIPQDDTIPDSLPQKQSIKIDLQSEEQIKFILDHLKEQREYVFSPEAKHYFSDLHSELYELRSSWDNQQEVLEAFLKRWSPGIIKLAMIMQLLENPASTEIGINALKSAFNILKPAIQSTEHLMLTELGESDYQRKCRMLLAWIHQKHNKKRKAITREQILTSNKLKGGHKEYDGVLDTLIESGKLSFVPKKPKMKSEYLPIVEEG